MPSLLTGAYASGNYKAYDYYNGNATTAGAATSANYQFAGSDISFCWASQACCEWLQGGRACVLWLPHADPSQHSSHMQPLALVEVCASVITSKR